MKSGDHEGLYATFTIFLSL